MSWQARAHYLADIYGWSTSEARKIWSFGPEGAGTNILVDLTEGVTRMNEVRESIIGGFNWTMDEGGPLMDDKVRLVPSLIGYTQKKIMLYM